MIDRLREIAIKGRRLRLFAPIIALFAAGLFGLEVIGVVNSSKDDYFLIPSVVLLLWAAILCTVFYSFPNVPKRLEKGCSLVKRVKNSLLRFYYYVLAFVLITSTVGVISFSFKLVGVWTREFA